jgi:CheY-like chemotaxis protein
MSDGSAERAQQKRRILIVDASPLLRRGLAALIDNESDLAVYAAAATAREALDAIVASGPALVIADFSFEPRLGLDLVREIRARHPELPVLMMSIDGGPVYAERARSRRGRLRQQAGDERSHAGGDPRRAGRRRLSRAPVRSGARRSVHPQSR